MMNVNKKNHLIFIEKEDKMAAVLWNVGMQTVMKSLSNYLLFKSFPLVSRPRIP